MGLSDEDHLRFASGTERVVFTQDDDFLTLHASGIKHAGIAYAHQRTPIGRIISGLLLIHDVMEPSEMADRVEFI